MCIQSNVVNKVAKRRDGCDKARLMVYVFQIQLTQVFPLDTALAPLIYLYYIIRMSEEIRKAGKGVSTVPRATTASEMKGSKRNGKKIAAHSVNTKGKACGS